MKVRTEKFAGLSLIRTDCFKANLLILDTNGRFILLIAGRCNRSLCMKFLKAFRELNRTYSIFNA